MKKCLMILCCLLWITSASAQKKSYRVEARIDNPHHYPVVLSWFANGKFFIDSSAVQEKGVYVFKGPLPAACVAELVVWHNPSLSVKYEDGVVAAPGLSFFLTGDTIRVNGSVDKIYMASVKGGAANRDWNEVRPQEQSWNDKVWMLTKKTFSGEGIDSIAYTQLLIAKSNQEEQFAKLHTQFIKRHPVSLLSAYFLCMHMNDIQPALLGSAYAKLGNDGRNSFYGTLVKRKIAAWEATSPGKPAIAIHKRDRYGNPIDLAALKGKYVLLDFWGSWCGPCRKSNPELKALYRQYHERGFEIIGIAAEAALTIDESRANWIQALTEDDLPWPQVLNNEGVEEYDAVKTYAVTAFPTKILVDKDGKIVDRFIGIGPESERLHTALDRLFK